MYDRRSIYALNKKNPDAIVLPDADGNLICLTCADFTDEAEFRRWKRWSDQDFHAEDKSDVEESDHTTSMDMVPEAALAVPNEDALAEERQVREDQIRCAEAAVSGIRSILTGAQFYRLRQYCIEGKTESEIAEAEGVPFPVSWTVKMKKKQKETQDILSYHTQAAGCSDKARAKASGGRQPIEECGRTGL